MQHSIISMKKSNCYISLAKRYYLQKLSKLIVVWKISLQRSSNVCESKNVVSIKKKKHTKNGKKDEKRCFSLVEMNSFALYYIFLRFW